jgi:hypothetical protein
MSRQPRPHKRKPIIDAGNTRAYRQLWRVVDGAVFDALYTHQDYLTPKGQQCARTSINKRVVGSVLGFAEQSARGRSGSLPAVDRDGHANLSDPRMAAAAMSKGRAIWVRVARLFRSPEGREQNT